MDTKALNGEVFFRMLSGGLKNLKANSKTIDDLNVFPVPDGDTGSNMTSTFAAGFAEAEKFQSEKIGEVAKKLAHGMLLGARGNSGVILSQIFKGIQLGLSGYDSVNVSQLLAAYEKGIEQSYHAVVKPVEGTILTVFREATEYTKNCLNENSTIEDFYKAHLLGARIALPKTKDILQALKDADVIDSGGAGYLSIAYGMFHTLINPKYNPAESKEFADSSTGFNGAPVSNANFDSLSSSNSSAAPTVDISAFTRDSVLEFGYCTECLLRLQTVKVQKETGSSIEDFDVNLIINFLNGMGGESVVAFKEDDIIKLHVHTPNPGNVLNELRRYGEFLTIKIENMALQHEEIIKSGADSAAGKAGGTKSGGSSSEKKKIHKHIAIVCVANGQGVKNVFTDFGADLIIDGGQTGNPPASAFVDAYKQLNADHILVLPNNSNIILTAQQSAGLYSEAQIHVIPTKSVQQCFSALAVINSLAEDVEAMLGDVTEALEGVVYGDVAVSIRDVELCGKDIKKGDYLGMFGEKIVSVQKDKLAALMEMVSDMEDIEDKELFTLFYGKDVTKEEAEEAEKMISEKYPDLEVTLYDGGQDVYSFLASAE